MSKADDPAFAHVIGADALQYVATGLTKREYFAAAALQGFATKGWEQNMAANWAVEYADASRTHWKGNQNDG
jgi:hypothetical protein